MANIGFVKWFNESKGFGFIESEGSDYFVHFKAIKTEGFKTLKQDQRVEFRAEKSPKGMTAVDVVPL